MVSVMIQSDVFFENRFIQMIHFVPNHKMIIDPHSVKNCIQLIMLSHNNIELQWMKMNFTKSIPQDGSTPAT
jgi:hypothetical protein